MLREKLEQIYNILFETWGNQNWWPGDSDFEIIIGAILTQNTNWLNVEKAIKNLKAADCFTPEKLCQLDVEKLALLIKPAGYFNVKAKRLKNFLNWFHDEYHLDIESLTQAPTFSLREQLLSIKGIGPETSDSILLYALEKPVFVVDTYTARIMSRHRLIEPDADYEQLKDLFSCLEPDVKFFNEYHALLVRVGKEFCKPKPRCEICPLNCLEHDIESDY